MTEHSGHVRVEPDDLAGSVDAGLREWPGRLGGCFLLCEVGIVVVFLLQEGLLVFFEDKVGMKKGVEHRVVLNFWECSAVELRALQSRRQLRGQAEQSACRE